MKLTPHSAGVPQIVRTTCSLPRGPRDRRSQMILQMNTEMRAAEVWNRPEGSKERKQLAREGRADDLALRRCGRSAGRAAALAGVHSNNTRLLDQDADQVLLTNGGRAETAPG